VEQKGGRPLPIENPGYTPCLSHRGGTREGIEDPYLLIIGSVSPLAVSTHSNGNHITRTSPENAPPPSKN